MISATIKVRGIADQTLEDILDLLREEAKDLTVEQWSTNEPADYKPRHSRVSQPRKRAAWQA